MPHPTRVSEPEIIIEVDVARLGWPSEEELDQEEPYFAGNRRYQDFRGFDWGEAISAVRADRRLVGAVTSGVIAEDALQEELESFEFDQPPWGLDIGVAGAVAALSALGAIPVASCNGGRLGIRHSYGHPLVAFFALPSMVETLTQCATTSGVGLINSPQNDGTLIVFSPQLDGLAAFAKRLIRAR